MIGFTPALERLIEHFRLLPGIGYKSAVRMAFHILDMPEDKAKTFAEAMFAPCVPIPVETKASFASLKAQKTFLPLKK